MNLMEMNSLCQKNVRELSRSASNPFIVSTVDTLYTFLSWIQCTK